jgi:MFS transporter, DHA3 family, macrolide efflux protein
MAKVFSWVSLECDSTAWLWLYFMDEVLVFSLSALSNSNVRRVVASQFLSQICDKLMVVALLWVIANQYNASWVPWYVAAGGLPHLFLAKYSGAIISKLGVLKSVVVSELFRGLVLLGFAFGFGSETPPIVALLVLSGLVNFGSAIFNPAIMTLPLSIADDDTRPQVNAMIDSCFSLANVIGPVLSVILFAKFGLTTLMVLNGLSYLFAAIIQSGIKLDTKADAAPAASTEPQKSSARPPSLREILGREHLVRQMSLAFFAINIFGAPFLIFFPLYVKQVYHLEIGALATLESFFGAGAILGAAALAFARFNSKLGPRIVRSIFCVGVALTAFSLSPNLAVGSVALFFMGLFLTLANIWILTLFQSIVAGGDVPTVMSLVNLVSVAATPLSLGCMGLIIGHFPLIQIAVTSSLMFLAIGCVLGLLPRLREV